MGIVVRSLHLIGLEAEARRYCDRHNIRDHHTFERIFHSMRHAAFMKEIEPFIRQKVRIKSLRIVDHIKIRGDGSLGEVVYKPLPSNLEDSLRLWDEQIILSAQRWAVDSSPLLITV